jgi:hypothetical protein
LVFWFLDGISVFLSSMAFDQVVESMEAEFGFESAWSLGHG